MRKNEAGQADDFRPGFVMRRVRIDALRHISQRPIGTHARLIRRSGQKDRLVGTNGGKMRLRAI